MGRKKADVPADDLAGTVEGQSLEFFEKEKAWYEERTGKQVKYEPALPVTRTPIAEPISEEQREDETAADAPAEGEE